MIASNYDWRFQLAALYQLVHRFAKLGALAVAQPANPRGQALKLDSLARELHPARERLVLGKQFESEFVGSRNVLWVTAQCDPAKWTAPLAKQRTNVLGNKTRHIKCIRHAGFFGLSADVVSIIERDCAFFLQCEHRRSEEHTSELQSRRDLVCRL